MTSQQVSLIPTGQPYGERQQTEDRFRQAGLPQTQMVGPPAGVIEAPITQATEFDGQIDALAMREPEPGFQLRQDAESRLLSLLDTSPSPLLRDLAARFRQ